MNKSKCIYYSRKKMSIISLSNLQERKYLSRMITLKTDFRTFEKYMLIKLCVNKKKGHTLKKQMSIKSRHIWR